MEIPSTGRQYAGALVPLAALTGFLLQADPGQPAVELLTQNLLGNAISSAVITLIVGGLLVLVASDYTGRNTRRIQKEPGRTFLYGFSILIGFVVIFLILAITIIGLLVAVPLAIAAGFAFLIAVTAQKPTRSRVGGSASTPCNNPPTTVRPTP